jgi:cell division protein FtsZ
MTKNILPLNIKVIALGNRGCNVLERLEILEKQGIKRVAISVAGKVFSNLKIEDKIEIPYNSNLVRGTNQEKTARESVLEVKEDILKQIDNTDAIFLLGNLTNETICYQATELAKLAKQKGILVFFISSTPFPFEGKHKQKTANEMKTILEKEIDALLIVDNEKILTQVIPAQEALTQVDKVVVDLINTIVDLIAKYGVVNVDFADLKSTIQNAGYVYFNSISTDKKDFNTLTEELFSKTNLTATSENLNKVLYVIYAGKDILMDEINTIGEKIREKLSASARIIFGVVNDDNMDGKLKVVMIGG